MTDIQSRTEAMAEAVLHFLDNNAAIWNGTPKNVEKRDALQVKLVEINEIELIQTTNPHGNVTAKENLKRDMAQKAAPVARALQVLARDTGNAVLESEVDFSFSDLFGVKDTDAEDRCTIIRMRAELNAAALLAYGITAPMTTEVKTSVTAFHDSLGTPGAAKAVITAATIDLDRAFDELDTILSNLDYLMEFYRFTSATFWEGFHAARKRNDTGVRHIAARVHLIDKITKADLGSGSVEVQPIGLVKEAGNHSTVRLLDSETGIGTFDIIAHAQYYKDATVSDVVFEEGKIAYIEIEMEQE